MGTRPNNRCHSEPALKLARESPSGFCADIRWRLPRSLRSLAMTYVLITAQANDHLSQHRRRCYPAPRWLVILFFSASNHASNRVSPEDAGCSPHRRFELAVSPCRLTAYPPGPGWASESQRRASTLRGIPHRHARGRTAEPAACGTARQRCGRRCRRKLRRKRSCRWG